MRSVVRRIHPWSAAKVGAFVGVLHGLVIGVGLAGASAALAPLLEYVGQPITLTTWPLIILCGVFGGSVTAVIFVVGALFYNLVSRLGAALVVDIESKETSGSSRSSGKDSPRGKLLHDATFTKSLFDEK